MVWHHNNATNPREPGVRIADVSKALIGCGFNAATTKVVVKFVRARALELFGEDGAGWREATLFEYRRRDTQGRTPLHIMAEGNAADAIEVVLAELVELAGPTNQVDCQALGLSKDHAAGDQSQLLPMLAAAFSWVRQMPQHNDNPPSLFEEVMQATPSGG